MTCLITQLTDAVTDTNLMKITEIHLKIKTSAVKYIDFTAYQQSDVVGRIVGDGYFTDSTGSANYGKDHSYGDPYKVYLSAGEYDLYLSVKGTFRYIVFEQFARGTLFIIDNGLKYCDNVFTLSVGSLLGTDGELFNLSTDINKDMITAFYSKTNASIGEETVEGDLSDFNIPAMTVINVITQKVTATLSQLESSNTLTQLRMGGVNGKITGSVETLGQKFKNLTALAINGYGSGSSLNGSVEDMLDAMVAAGRSNGNVVVQFSGSPYVTYNGAEFGSSARTFNFGSQYPGGWALA